jgi:glycosyltransferase involved in cell wall biosynthesis
MRVLLNTAPYYGKGEGVRTFITELLRALHTGSADMEWDVILRHEDFERLELASDPRFRLAVGADGSARALRIPLIRFCWRNAFEHLALPATTRRYSVIHYLDSYGPLLPLDLVSGAPLALTVHDVIPLTTRGYHPLWVRRYLAFEQRHTIRRAKLILTNSSYTASEVRRALDIPTSRLRVLPFGVDPAFRPPTPAERAMALERYHITGPYIIAVGTIERRKNLARLAQAFASAKRDRSLPHHLLIVGRRGADADTTLRAIADTALGPAIRLLGYVPRADLPALIGGADALAYPSLEEGFGFPVLEGMACGTPVVTSDASSCAEIAGDACLLVDPTDVGALAGAIGEVCTDDALRRLLRAAGLARAQRYSWPRVADGVVDAYRELMA